MGKKTGEPFAAKHGQASAADVHSVIRETLTREAGVARMACDRAFQVATELKQPPEEIGRAADLLGIRLVKCQLGLFGYAPEKKTVRPAETVDPALEEAIRAGLRDGRLPCRSAWELAESFKVPKMTVSAACEALGIKLGPCQLGAF